MPRSLGRAGLGGMKEEWAEVARKGIDTMDPDIAWWARKRMGHENVSWGRLTSLKILVSGFVPGAANLLRDHHNAGADAYMHLALRRELIKERRAERGFAASQDTRAQAAHQRWRERSLVHV